MNNETFKAIDLVLDNITTIMVALWFAWWIIKGSNEDRR